MTSTEKKPTFTEIQGYVCTGCEAVSDSEDGPLYECGACGTAFNRNNSADGGSHRCPDCNKFASRLAEYSCSECGEGEAQEATVYQCDECGDLFAEEPTDHDC